MSVRWELIADLAMELIASAYGRGEDGLFLDDPAIRDEARAIDAIRKGNVARMERSLADFKRKRDEEAADLERQYGPRSA